MSTYLWSNQSYKINQSRFYFWIWKFYQICTGIWKCTNGWNGAYWLRSWHSIANWMMEHHSYRSNEDISRQLQCLLVSGVASFINFNSPDPPSDTSKLLLECTKFELQYLREWNLLTQKMTFSCQHSFL